MSTTTAVPEQLDVFALLGITPNIEARRINGHLHLVTAGNGWRARWTGTRWGWIFQRNSDQFGWETWEPDLPHGVEQVNTEADARDYLDRCVRVHGDDPAWLTKAARRRRAA